METFNITIAEASSKYIFNSYRLFRDLQSFLSNNDEISIEKLRLISENFRLVLNNLIQDLLLIEESIAQIDFILSNKIDSIIEFTRLSHLTEIIFLADSKHQYLYVIKWLQVLGKLS